MGKYIYHYHVLIVSTNGLCHGSLDNDNLISTHNDFLNVWETIALEYKTTKEDIIIKSLSLLNP